MDYEAFDKDATKWGNAAVELQGSVATIEEVCQAAHEPYPCTEDDIHYLAVKCRAWGIKTNVDNEPFWK